MNRLTYKQAEDLIFKAYFNDKIKPYIKSFCFCGTLCYRKNEGLFWNPNLYSFFEYEMMEERLLSVLRDNTVGGVCNIYGFNGFNYGSRYEITRHPNYEDALFKGMCASLEVLKQIHRDRGEDVDFTPLTKRISQKESA